MSHDQQVSADLTALRQQYEVLPQTPGAPDVSGATDQPQVTQASAMGLGTSGSAAGPVFTTSTVRSQDPVLVRDSQTAKVVVGAGVGFTGRTLARGEQVVNFLSPPAQDVVPRASLSGRLDGGLKIHIGSFKADGKEKGSAYMKRFEVVAHVSGWDDNRKLGELIGHMEEKAAAWVGRLSGSALDSWGSLKAAFLRQFDRKLGPSAAQRLRSLRQKQKQSIDEYLNECYEVFDEAGLEVDSSLAKDYFLSGLRSDLQVAARAQVDNMELEELARFISVVDAGIQSVRSYQSGQSGEGGASSSGKGGRDRREVSCFQCGEKGHIRPDCPQKAASGGSATTSSSSAKQAETKSGAAAPAKKAETQQQSSQEQQRKN